MIDITDKNTWLTAKHNTEIFPQWFKELQQKQLQEFVLPTTREEQWKYTDISMLAKQPFVFVEKTTVNKLQIKKHCLPEANVLVFINGQFCAELSLVEQLPTEVVVLPLNDAWQLYPELFKQYLTQEFKQQPFAKLNTVLMQNGIFVHVPKNVELTRPVQLLFINDAQAVSMSVIRNLLIVEENSAAVFLESYLGPESNFLHFNNIVTQIIANKNSRIQHYKLQNENLNAMHIAHTHVSQAENSCVQAYHFGLGGQLAREDVQIDLDGHGADSELIGLYLANNKQHIDYHTRIDHKVPHTNSDEFFKGILTDHARGIFNGKVVVYPNAQKTNAKQANKNLLLTKTAEIDTKPELEIYADDVKCAHGATVGQLDETALFYLRSRGISEQEAVYLLIDAFADEILDKIKSATIKEFIKLHVLGKLA